MDTLWTVASRLAFIALILAAAAAAGDYAESQYHAGWLHGWNVGWNVGRSGLPADPDGSEPEAEA